MTYTPELQARVQNALTLRGVSPETISAIHAELQNPEMLAVWSKTYTETNNNRFTDSQGGTLFDLQAPTTSEEESLVCELGLHTPA
jgi:hypothetical protein